MLRSAIHCVRVNRMFIGTTKKNVVHLVLTLYFGVFLLLFNAEKSGVQAASTTLSIQETVTKPLPGNSFVCTHGEKDNGTQLIAGLRGAFINKTVEVDFVIIIDRSKSITLDGHNHTKSAIKLLLDYLINSGLSDIRPDRTRISVVSFGKNIITELEGIRADIDPTTICEIDDFVDTYKHERNDQSKITGALERAKTIFATSARKNKDVKKVLFLFTDGQATGEHPGELAEQLAQEKVEIFAAGVGSPAIMGWMTAEDEQLLIGMARTRNKHYACVETWERILKIKLDTLKPASGNDTGERGTQDQCLWLTQSSATCTPACEDSKGEQCACNIPDRKLQCEKEADIACPEPGATTSNNPPKKRPPTEPLNPPPTDPALGFETLLIAIGVPIFLVLVVVIFLICFVVHKKRKKRGSPGPPLPTPPVPRRLVRPNLNILYGSEPIYGNNEPMESNNGYRSEEPMESTEMQYQTVAKVEKQMPGWGDFLIEKAHEHGFNHISIHDTVGHRWASTPGKHVKSKELKEIMKSFNSKDGNYVSSDVKVAGEMYKVDHAATSDSKISAKSKGGDAVFISQQGPYIVVGIAPPRDNDNYQEAIQELDQYLKKTTEPTFNPEEDNIYSDTAAIQKMAQAFRS